MGSYKKVCEYCKKEFIAKDSRVKYCSDECRYNSRMNNKKSIHKICGSKSGREVDKIKETGLKPMITDKGNVLFEQGRLSLECRKLYTDVLRKENFLDPSVYEQWYTTHGGLHHVYVAEITSAWIKD